MATSSKVVFDLKTLKANALKSIDERIARAQTEVDSHEDPAALEQRIADWRTEQERRISDVFSKLGDGRMRDRDLAAFSVQPMPEVTTRDRYRAEGKLRDLQDLRSQIVAKTDSLVPDEKGYISLTKTQLAEFFGL